MQLGIELNQDDMHVGITDEKGESVLRVFRIAKECGCKFYCGSDAHSPQWFDQFLPIMEKAVDVLDLTENDKIDFCR